MSFGERLAAARAARGPLCVGIDPHPSLLTAWGLPDSADGLDRFAQTCASAFAETFAVLKPQSAFFERFGAAGIAILQRTIRDARAAGALVLLDVKRGDIGSTMSAYADAYLDAAAPLAADAITVTPYVGVGALEPAFDLAAKHGAGVFVVTLTSNKEGADVQRAAAQQIVDDLARRNDGAEPIGSIGVVVGATVGTLAVDLSALNGPILAPGVGAQGGTADDVRRLFAGLPGVLPAVSRDVLRAGPQIAALRDTARHANDEFAFLVE